MTTTSQPFSTAFSGSHPLHPRVTGFSWVFLGVLGVGFFSWQLGTEWPHLISAGRVSSYLPLFLPWLIAIGVGLGLLLRSRWARVASEILAAVLLAFCVCTFLIPPPDFWESWAAAVFILAALFAAYALVVAWFVKHERDAA